MNQESMNLISLLIGWINSFLLIALNTFVGAAPPQGSKEHQPLDLFLIFSIRILLLLLSFFGSFFLC